MSDRIENFPIGGGGGWDEDNWNVPIQVIVKLNSASMLNILQLGTRDKVFPLTSKYGNARISVTTFLLR